MENLSQKVKDQLKRSGKTQKELANYLQISEYGLIKMMQRGSLKSDYMGKIMKFLNVDLNFFGFEPRTDSENIHPLTKVMNGTTNVESGHTKKVEDLERIIESQRQTIESQKELIEALKAQIKK